MKATGLLRFILIEQLEYKWIKEDVVLFVPIHLIESFQEVIDNSGIYNDGGISCLMKGGYFVFEMKNIVEYFGFELIDIFNK